MYYHTSRFYTIYFDKLSATSAKEEDNSYLVFFIYIYTPFRLMKMVLAIRERFRRNWYINGLEITKSYKSHDLCLSEDSGQFSLVFLLFLPFFFQI